VKIGRKHLAEVIAERTLSVGSSKKLAQEIAAYLLTESRTADLEPLMRDILEYRAGRGQVEATAVSAFALSDEVRQELKSLVKSEYPDAKDIQLHDELDSKTVGGVRLDLPNEQLDLTVRAKLAKFKQFVGGAS